MMLQLYERKGRKIYKFVVIGLILIFTLVLFTYEYISVSEHIDEYNKIQIPNNAPVAIESVHFSGEIEYIEGNVEVRDKSDAEWFRAGTARILESGNEVRTLNNSRAIITFEDGSSVRMDENTHIVIENPEGHILVRVESGSIYNRVSPNTEREYSVGAKPYTVTAKGTEFFVQKGYDGVGVLVVKSRVDVKNDRGVVIGDVKEGTKAVVLNDKIQKDHIEPSDLENDFFVWNKEDWNEDEEKVRSTE